MQQRIGVITMKGEGITLLGEDVKESGQARDCPLVNQDLKDVRLSDFSGKVRIITTYPSLDTPVCNTMGRKFNETAAELGDDLEVIAVSMDLPFAQKRWCGQVKADNMTMLSDYKTREFGKSYGILIKELGLLARSIFIIDKDNVIRYKEIVPEVTDEPNYDAAVEAAKKLL
jgi:thiol peroxidase